MPDPVGSPAMWQDPAYEREYGPADVYAAPAGSGVWTPQPFHFDKDGNEIGGSVGEALTMPGLVASVVTAVVTTFVVLKLFKKT